MSSQVNPSSINAQYPVPGVPQSSQGFRSNFLAIQNSFSQYVVEMNDMINKAIVSAPLLYGNNSNINNFGGMQNSNLALFDYGLVVSNITASVANAVPTLNFSNSSVANIHITAASPAIQTIALSNFPGLGYSEFKIIVEADTPPQYLNFSNIVPGGVIYGASKITGFTGANLAISTTEPRILNLGSSDGQNWFISSPSHADARSYTPTTSVGSPGDSAGMLTYDASFLYVCTASYNGSTAVWKRISLTAF